MFSKFICFKFKFWHFSILIAAILVYSLNTDWKEDFSLPQFIRERGYPAEEHFVETEDGYIITVYRIPHGRNNVETNKKPIVLNHGLMESSAGYIMLGPGRSLGFLLADGGYDVWMLNARGSTYSNRHKTILETDKRQFYNFSWHEIGLYDVPATIDYVLEHTNQTKLHYVGHSQGTTSFFVMASMRPDYNKKIKVGVLLAPVAKMTEVKPFFAILAPQITRIIKLLGMFNIYDIGRVAKILRLASHLCQNELVKRICQIPYDFTGGYPNPGQRDLEIFSKLAYTSPSNIALKQLIHYFQVIKSKRFAQFDYGRLENQKIYNMDHPPDYNLELIDTPLALFGGNNDQYSNVKDIKEISKLLKNSTVFVVPNDGWNHLNFVFALDVVSLLYNDVIKVLNKH